MGERIVQKTGILWKLRFPEFEISLVEERLEQSALVRTFKCLPHIFEHMRKEEIREGCYIQVVFNTDDRVITAIEFIVLEGFVTKWAPKYAFVHTPVLPQIKLGRNNRVTDCKFIHNPPSSLSSTYLNPRNCDFSLENNMEVRFALCVNLKKATRNPPYLDLKAVNVQRPATGMKNSEETPRSSMSSLNTDSESRIDSWMARRMSSPRVDAKKNSPSERRNHATTPHLKLPHLDEGLRRRGHSTPVKTSLKRGPSNSRNGRVMQPASAPVTPLKEMLAEADLPETYDGLMDAFRPPSAKEHFETPPQRLMERQRCLRCQNGEVDFCTHKPPHSRKQQDASTEDLSLVLKNRDVENERLRLEVEKLRQELRDQRTQHKQQRTQQKQQQQTNSPPIGYFRPQGLPPALSTGPLHMEAQNVSYQQDIINYEHIFTHSPTPSPSSSPVTSDFLDPDKFLPFFDSNGRPSSTHSDVMPPEHRYEMRHHHYGTPLTSAHLLSTDPMDDMFLHGLSSSNSNGSNESNTGSRSAGNTPLRDQQLTVREFQEYVERRRPAGNASPPMREMSEVLSVLPMPIGERPRRNQSKAHHRYNGRWGQVMGEQHGMDSPPKRRPDYGHPPHLNTTMKKKHNSYEWEQLVEVRAPRR